MSPEHYRRIPVTNQVMLEELEPAAGKALDAHITNKEKHLWNPDELVPVQPRETLMGPISPFENVTLTSLYVNGLTEDNLPHYTAAFVEVLTRKQEAWRTWTNRWTWEESLHARSIDYYDRYTGSFDSDWLEKARKAQVSGGHIPHPRNVAEALIYATVQEDLTQVAHRRVAPRVDDVGKFLFGQIAGDEGRHHIFNRDVAKALRDQFPDQFALGLLAIIGNFEMPGTGIPGFIKHATIMAQERMFSDLDVATSIVDVSKDHWSVDTLGAEVRQERAKRAVDKIHDLLELYGVLASSGVSTIDDRGSRLLVDWTGGTPKFSREPKAA